MSSEGFNPAPEAPQGQPALPNLQVVAQYIKDLSFENPGATANLQGRPQIELGVDLNAARLSDQDMFEVELKIRVLDGDDGSGGRGDAGADGVPLPAVLREVHDGDLGMRGAEGVQRRARAVPGAVV